LHWPTGDEIAGVTQSLDRFFDPVGMGVPPAKLREKPAVGSAGDLVAGTASEASRTQPRPLAPGPRPLFFDPVFFRLCEHFRTLPAFSQGELVAGGGSL